MTTYDIRLESVIRSTSEKRQCPGSGQVAKGRTFLKRRFLEEFYVICGSDEVTVTLTNPLLIITTHYLIKHHHTGSVNYAAAACSSLEAANSHDCNTKMFFPARRTPRWRY
jgi:hypothetical protein